VVRSDSEFSAECCLAFLIFEISLCSNFALPTGGLHRISDNYYACHLLTNLDIFTPLIRRMISLLNRNSDTVGHKLF